MTCSILLLLILGMVCGCVLGPALIALIIMAVEVCEWIGDKAREGWWWLGYWWLCLVAVPLEERRNRKRAEVPRG